MKNFTAPEIEVEKFDVSDVITTSELKENDSPIV